MGLKNNSEILKPYTFVMDSGRVVRDKLNENFSLLRTELQHSKDSIENALSSITGHGFAVPPSVSHSGGSLQISFGEIVCIFGKEVVFPPSIATVLSSQENGELFLTSKMEWHTSTPENDDYFIAGEYTSDEAGVTSFVLSKPLRILGTNSIVELIGEFGTSIDAAHGTTTEYVDHSNEYSFLMPGFIGVYCGDDEFVVEVLDYPNVLSDSNYPDGVVTGNTEDGFWVKIDYIGNAEEGILPVTITYKRTGF